MKIFITIFIFAFILSVSIKANAQWVQCNGIWGGSIVYTLASGNYLYAGTNGNGVYISSNNGQNWTQTSLNYHYISSLAISGNTIIAGTTDDRGVYLSTDNGVNWTRTSLNTGNSVIAVAISGNNIFAGIDGNLVDCVYLSTNNGLSWVSRGLWDSPPHSFVTSGNNIYAGTYGVANRCGVYLSINNGLSWLEIFTVANLVVTSLAINGNIIIAGTNSGYGGLGVYLSTNEGVNWTQTSLNNQKVSSVAIDGNNIMAGTDTGVYVSTIYDTNWTKRNEGFPPNVGRILAFCITNGTIFAGTNGNSVWRRPLQEVIGIKPISSNIPDEYKLFQNYPNPFNPSTNIRYEIPKSGFVTLKIYDALGKKVETLVNEKQSAGIYEVEWNSSNLSSGVYFYKFNVRQAGSLTGGYTETKRMALIK